MIVPRVIPCLLKQGDALVKTIRFADARYIGDPINTAQIYNEFEVDELCLIDILATRKGAEPDYGLIAKIAEECFMPLTYGGGITSVGQMRQLFKLGVEKVIVGNAAVSNRELVSEAARLFGSQSIVIAIDARKNVADMYDVFCQSGTVSAKIDPVTFARAMESAGAGEILLTSIDRDGAMDGYDLELVRKVAGAINLPLIACGGAGSLEDCKKAVDAGASAAAAGSLFVYQGRNRSVLVNFPDRGELEELFS